MTISYGNDAMGKVLTEKENYISNLENEISEMRKEIEIQREQLLQAEAQTIGGDTKANHSSIYMSLGGAQSSIYQPNQVLLNGPSSP